LGSGLESDARHRRPRPERQDRASARDPGHQAGARCLTRPRPPSSCGWRAA
jgi:hypothetical protein